MPERVLVAIELLSDAAADFPQPLADELRLAAQSLHDLATRAGAHYPVVMDSEYRRRLAKTVLNIVRGMEQGDIYDRIQQRIQSSADDP